MSRRIRLLLFPVLLASSLPAQAPAPSGDTLAYTTTSVRLRERPFPTARPIAVLSQGTTVRLYTCSEGWCSVTTSNLSGYLLEEFLSRQAPQAATQSTGRGYINVDGEFVPSPTRTADGQPPPGASGAVSGWRLQFQQTPSRHMFLAWRRREVATLGRPLAR
jgi:hypothetical protein